MEVQMKKLLLSTLSYALITMAIAFPWHFTIFKDLYHSFGIYNRAEPIIPLGFLSMLIQGLILGYLYPKFYKDGSHLREGLRFGLVMGAFLYSVSTLANAAKIDVSPMSTWLGIQAAFHLIQFAICGVVIGFIHSKK